MSTPRYVTIKALAARWGIAKSTVYALVASGALPATRFGTGRGTIRIKEEDAVAYEAKQKRDDEQTYAEHFA